jgi:hypothetical protein
VTQQKWLFAAWLTVVVGLIAFYLVVGATGA